MAAARISHPVLFIIICLCYSLMLSIHVPHATSLPFSFNFSTSGDPFTGPGAQLRLEGDAKFSPPQIELTKNDISGDDERSIGRVSYAQPVPLWDNVTGELSSFNTNFSFKIRPAATTTVCPVTGDGMAFFLGHYPSVSLTNNYSLDRNIGLFNHSSNMNATGDARIVAVEFDTFRNAGVDTSNNHHYYRKPNTRRPITDNLTKPSVTDTNTDSFNLDTVCVDGVGENEYHRRFIL